MDEQGTGIDPETNEKKGIAYGTINMTTGKKWGDAELQIRTITAQHGNVLMWFFDFVCTPNQMPTAQNYVTDAINLIVELCPDIRINRVVVGVCTKDADRPAKQVMMGIAAQMNQEEILRSIDLQSERIHLWVGGRLQAS